MSESGDYISREAAQKIICGWCGVCQNPTLHDLMRCDDICPQFAQIPAADVRPVRRGKWVQVMGKYDWMVKCSRCNGVPLETSKFCPNCGATMFPEPPNELTGTDMRGEIRRDDAGNVIDWGITGPPGDVGKTEEEQA